MDRATRRTTTADFSSTSTQSAFVARVVDVAEIWRDTSTEETDLCIRVYAIRWTVWTFGSDLLGTTSDAEVEDEQICIKLEHLALLLNDRLQFVIVIR